MAHNAAAGGGGGGPNKERSMLETREGCADVFGWNLRKRMSKIRNTATATVGSKEERQTKWDTGYTLIDWSE